MKTLANGRNITLTFWKKLLNRVIDMASLLSLFSANSCRVNAKLTEDQIVKISQWIREEPFIPNIAGFKKKAGELGVKFKIMMDIWMDTVTSVLDGYTTVFITNGPFYEAVFIKEILDSQKKTMDDVENYSERIFKEKECLGKRNKH